MSERATQKSGRTDQLRALLREHNATSLRNIGLLIAAIAAVSVIFWLSAHIIGLDENGILASTLRSFKDSPWALPIVAIAFTAASLIGAPQFLLIAVTVAAFGPLNGFIYSVLSTVLSASVNFAMARVLGADWLHRRGWPGVNAFSNMIGRNGFFAALLVRIVPSAPFIVVNMGMGLTRMTYASFIAGTAVGILPKTALIALLGKVVERAQSGDLEAIRYLVLAAACWLSLAFIAKWIIRRRETAKNPAAKQP